MSLELFHKVPAGAIETLFDAQNQCLFKRVDIGRNLGIRNIRDNFKDFSLHHVHPRSEIEGVGVTDTLGRTKNCHDIFINSDSAIEIAVYSEKTQGSCLSKMAPQKRCRKKYKKNINKPSQTVTIKYKPLSLQMKKITENFEA